MMSHRADIDTLALTLATRLRRIIRLPRGWRLWTETADFKFGTFYELHDDGRAVRFVVREGEADEIMQVRPSTSEILRSYER